MNSFWLAFSAPISDSSQKAGSLRLVSLTNMALNTTEKCQNKISNTVCCERTYI
jgi:hypothetical protein